jgi:hypothetical protein
MTFRNSPMINNFSISQPLTTSAKILVSKEVAFIDSRNKKVNILVGSLFSLPQ